MCEQTSCWSVVSLALTVHARRVGYIVGEESAVFLSNGLRKSCTNVLRHAERNNMEGITCQTVVENHKALSKHFFCTCVNVLFGHQDNLHQNGYR